METEIKSKYLNILDNLNENLYDKVISLKNMLNIDNEKYKNDEDFFSLKKSIFLDLTGHIVQHISTMQKTICTNEIISIETPHIEKPNIDFFNDIKTKVYFYMDVLKSMNNNKLDWFKF